jgi:hypothetical protein
LEQLTEQVKRNGNPWRALISDASAPAAPAAPAPAPLAPTLAPVKALAEISPDTRSEPQESDVLALTSSDELGYVPFEPSLALAAAMQPDVATPVAERIQLQAKAGW